jgi:hypothetical protein
MSIKQSASPTANAFQIKDSNDNVWFAAQSDKTLLIPPAESNGNLQSLTWITDGVQFGNTELRIQRDHSSNNGYGARLALQDAGVTAFIKLQCNSFVQNYTDLEFHHPTGKRLVCPQSGGVEAYNGGAFTNGNECAFSIKNQDMFPGGGGLGYRVQSSMQILSTFYGLNGVTKVEHLSSLWIEGPPTHFEYYTQPQNRWSIDCGTGQVKSTGYQLWSMTTGEEATDRRQGSIIPSWIDDTEGSQTGEVTFNVSDYDGDHTMMTMQGDGTQGKLSFFGVPAVERQSAENIGEVIAALQAYGLLI